VSPQPGDTLVNGETVVGLVISVTPTEGLIGVQAYQILLLTINGLVECLLHAENRNKTWRTV
jgi:hypothetical protein